MVIWVTRSALCASKGDYLTDMRNKIMDLDKAAPAELCKSYRTHAGLRGWLLGKNSSANINKGSGKAGKGRQKGKGTDKGGYQCARMPYMADNGEGGNTGKRYQSRYCPMANKDRYFYQQNYRSRNHGAEWGENDRDVEYGNREHRKQEIHPPTSRLRPNQGAGFLSSTQGGQ